MVVFAMPPVEAKPSFGEVEALLENFGHFGTAQMISRLHSKTYLVYVEI